MKKFNQNIRDKYKDKQIIKLDTSLATENNIVNELRESNESLLTKKELKMEKKIY